jgi:hypothetical protein
MLCVGGGKGSDVCGKRGRIFWVCEEGRVYWVLEDERSAVFVMRERVFWV